MALPNRQPVRFSIQRGAGWPDWHVTFRGLRETVSRLVPVLFWPSNHRFSKKVAGTEVPWSWRTAPGRSNCTFSWISPYLEAFIDAERSSVARVHYAERGDLAIAVFAENGGAVLKSLNVWQMKSIW